MSFTTRCFIRKNSKELQDKLADIGYNICQCANFENSVWLNTLPINGTIHGKGYLDAEMEFPDWTVEKELNRFFSEDPRYIDCGENEELFLAIAALRDDTSDGQYWVFNEDFDKYKKGDFVIGHFTRCSCYCHKATVKELIEYFAQ